MIIFDKKFWKKFKAEGIIADDFEAKLTNIDGQNLGIPESKFEAIVRMPSTLFARVFKDLSNIGDTVKISVENEGVEFYTRGDVWTSSIFCRKNALLEDEPGGGTTIEMREPISAVFALRYMNSFTRATPLENRVTFYLSSELPMVIEYQMAEMEYVRYYIAPAMGQYGAEASPLRGQDEEGSYQDSSEDDEAELPMVVDEGSPLRDQDDDRSSQDSSESAW